MFTAWLLTLEKIFMIDVRNFYFNSGVLLA